MKRRLLHFFALIAFVMQGVAAASAPVSLNADHDSRHCAEQMSHTADRNADAAGSCCGDSCMDTTDCVSMCAMTAIAPIAVEFVIAVAVHSGFDFDAQRVPENTYPPLYPPPIA